MAYMAVATMLMLSTIGSFNVGVNVYFPFTLAMVIVTAVANGLSQNAAFAFAASFGRTEYAPAIMTGEALAALLPSAIGKAYPDCNTFLLTINQKSYQQLLSHHITST